MNQGLNPYQAPSAQVLSPKAERDWKWLLFSFEGRATRGDYWKATGLMMLGVVLLGIIAAVGMRGLGGAPGEVGLIVAIIVIAVPLFWMSLAVGVKRWHDRNKSGLWVLIGMIPYLGSFWVLIECGCLRGTEGDNAYGPDPLA